MPLALDRVKRQPVRSPRIPPAKDPRGTRRRVLVIDPCRDTLSTMRWLLQLWGFNPIAVETGPQALASTLTHDLDAIVMELRLPGMNGWHLAKVLQESLGPACPPLIAVSVFGRVQDRARSREAGFECHLVKPAPPKAMKIWLEAASRRSSDRS
jgi:DNA-binding response OmpR family regulator